MVGLVGFVLKKRVIFLKKALPEWGMTIIIGARLCDDLAVVIGDQLISCEETLQEESKEYTPKILAGLHYIIGASGNAECCDILLDSCQGNISIEQIVARYNLANQFTLENARDSCLKMQKVLPPAEEFTCDVVVALSPGDMFELEYGSLKPKKIDHYCAIGVGETHVARYLRKVDWKLCNAEQRFLYVLGAYNEAIMKNLYCDGVPTIYLVDTFTREWREDTGTLALRIATCDSHVISNMLKEESLARLLVEEPKDVLEFAESVVINSGNPQATRRHLYGFSKGKVV